MAPETTWNTPVVLTGAQSGGSELALATTGSIPHLVWNRNGTLYHAQQSPAGWSAPIAIAMGESPVLGATPDGHLHCLFANTFAGSYEIYHTVWNGVSWSLPINVSHTSGDSTQPALAVGPAGGLHAAWADTTPGYSSIYYGLFANGFWTSGPIPNGRGLKPALSVSPDNSVDATWQDTGGGASAFDIFCARRKGQVWGLPDLVSDSKAQSIEASVAAGPDGECYVVWQEQQANAFEVHFAQRLTGGWTAPVALSTGSQDCLFPKLSQAPHGVTELAWLQGGRVEHRACLPGFQGQWLSVDTASADALANGGSIAVGDLALASGSDGALHVAWSALKAGGSWQIYLAKRAPELKQQVFLPVIR